MSTIEETLEEREKRYGNFTTHADITQKLKKIVWTAIRSKCDYAITHVQSEALDMIMHKVGRILNGDPSYADNWHDIAGYATLVEKELNNEK